MSARPLALVIAGPTASGKSALALRLAARIPAEIISVDSAQVFCGMDIGTAKPSAAERAAVPHHLIDLIDPTESYSAARFREDAIALMQDILARGRTPILVGGTMLYLKALREGLADLPSATPEMRAGIAAEAQAHGWPALHAQLARHDPETAARLAPNDSQRIGRALEILRTSGRPLSDWLAQPATNSPLPCELCGIGLQPADMAGRKVLHERIAQRFDVMLATGLLEEVRDLRQRYTLHPNLPSMRCVGYRQAWEHIDGVVDLATMRDKGIFATRQLAKRQITWLRSMDWLTTVDFLDEAQVEATIATTMGTMAANRLPA